MLTTKLSPPQQWMFERLQKGALVLSDPEVMASGLFKNKHNANNVRKALAAKVQGEGWIIRQEGTGIGRGNKVTLHMEKKF